MKSGEISRETGCRLGELSKNIGKFGDLGDFDRKRFYGFMGFIVFFCVLDGC